MQSQTLTGRKNEPKERQRKNKLGSPLLQIPRKKNFLHVISASSTVRFTQFSSFYFVLQALFSNILVMPFERTALAHQFHVVQ